MSRRTARPASPPPVVTTLSADRRTLTIRIPVSFRNHRAGKQIVTPAGSPAWSADRVDSALIRAIVRAHHWRSLLESGKYASAAELAKAENINDSYLSRLLRLTLLAPDIVQAILDGRQPKLLEVKALAKPLPSGWELQRKRLGFASLGRTSNRSDPGHS
jgi:hypothetical protein